MFYNFNILITYNTDYKDNYLLIILSVERDSNPWAILGESIVVSGYQSHLAHGSCYVILKSINKTQEGKLKARGRKHSICFRVSR